MKISVLINNYNYEKYVCDAVKSVLQQSLLPDEIIVVDDGSSDDSVFRLKQKFGAESRVKVISKENNGQLSSFNTGYQIASGRSKDIAVADPSRTVPRMSDW
ncbi:MAG: glycosyltransferase family 2 protein [Dissulfuribacterales bacterium]